MIPLLLRHTSSLQKWLCVQFKLNFDFFQEVLNFSHISCNTRVQSLTVYDAIYANDSSMTLLVADHNSICAKAVKMAGVALLEVYFLQTM